MSGLANQLLRAGFRASKGRVKTFISRGILGFVAGCLSLAAMSVTADSLNVGPLFDQFPLTLRDGTRTEAVGPFFNTQTSGAEEAWAVPPICSSVQDADTDSREFDFTYPIITYDRFGPEYRLQFLQLLSFSGGGLQSGKTTDRFTLFPFYFQQRSGESNLNYTAVMPFYGTLKNRLLRDEIHFVLWPIYVKTIRRPGFGTVGAGEALSLRPSWSDARRGELTTYNYVAPFFHLRYGDGLRGWQFWPFAGHELQAITTRTNSWGDPVTIPGHERTFVLWPFWIREQRGIGTTNEGHFFASLPFYTSLRSPLRDATTYFWPFGLSLTDDREKRYHETGFLWPVFAYARGEGKTTTRVWPLFGRSHNDILESNFYLWPVYRYNRLHSDPLDRERTRILFILYSDTHQLNTQTKKDSRRVDCWPLFTASKTFDGSSRLQLLALLEPIIPNNKSIERNYSPLWSLWRSEKNGKTGASSQSLLWNLYRHQVTADQTKETSFLLGLFQHRKSAAGTSLRLFYIPVKRAPAKPVAVVDSENQMAHLPAGAHP